MAGRESYHKLVRDRIPEIIRADGRHPEIEVMEDDAYRQALREKLVEEAEEAFEADGDALVKELADVLEIIDAMYAAFDIEPAVVRERQKQRRDERGGFERKLKLLWVDEEQDDGR